MAGGAPADFRIAGSAACTTCHTRDCELWNDTPHAHAWQSLVAQGAHVDSYCQQCHTTGYGVAGGFASVRRTPERTSVGCESCHGPAAAHVESPTTRTTYSGRAMSRCEACHDRENSPRFNANEYWAQIVHGEQAPAGEQGASAAAALDAAADSTTEDAK
jgi:hypothetical protein